MLSTLLKKIVEGRVEQEEAESSSKPSKTVKKESGCGGICLKQHYASTSIKVLEISNNIISEGQVAVVNQCTTKTHCQLPTNYNGSDHFC